MSGLPISETYVPCRTLDGDHRRWHAFLIVSVATPFVLMVPVLLYRIHHWITSTTHKAHKDPVARLGWDTVLTFSAARFASDLTIVGQLLKLLGVVCAVGSLIIYWSDSANPCNDVEMCQRWRNNAWWEVDLAFNCFFLVYYIIRFAAAPDKLRFIFAPMQLADYFTVPVIFVAIGLSRNWHGLRFLRIINMLWVTDLLHRVRLITSVQAVQLGRLIVYVTMAVVIGAGSFLLLECQGDPWDIEGTRQTGVGSTFWNYAYFSVVTISTVGYGDIGCKTVLGKLFTSLYIFACLFFIASFIATAASLMPPPRRYPKFDHSQYYGHIVLCGHVTAETLQRFLEEMFENVDRRGIPGIYIIVLHPDDPDEDMLLLLNDYQAHVEYIRGSPLDDAHLRKARLSVASACIVLTNHRSTGNETGDILHVISVKNHAPNVRVLIQTVEGATAAFLKRSAQIDGQAGDVVMCKRNLIAGLVGMSCAVPGFSTLAANLITYKSIPMRDATNIPVLYLRGQNMVLTSVAFSPAFYGLTFAEAVELCFTRLEVVLMAVYGRNTKGANRVGLLVNPTAACIISPDFCAQVIAPTDQHARVVEFYCRTCHADTLTPLLMAPCHCEKPTLPVETSGTDTGKDDKGMLGVMRNISKVLVPDSGTLEMSLVGGNQENGDVQRRDSEDAWVDENMAAAAASEVSDTRHQTSLDSTGMFHYSPIDDEHILSVKAAQDKQFINHIVIFILDTAPGCSVGLLHTLMPLRSSRINHDEMRDILIVGNMDDLESEYQSVAILPRVYAINADPRQMAVIRVTHLDTCFRCVILSANNGSDSEKRVDQAVIVMTLQLRAMDFGYSTHTYSLLGNETHHRTGRDLPIVSVLENPASLRFFSHDHSANSWDDHKTTIQHMTGSVLIATEMESLIVPAYFNAAQVRLFSSLISGGVSRQLDQILAEGKSLLPGQTNQSRSDRSANRQMLTTVDLITIADSPFSQFIDRSYGELFVYAHRELGYLCLGLYRLFRKADSSGQVFEEAVYGGGRRFVATNPPASLLLDASDSVYVLLPAAVL